MLICAAGFFSMAGIIIASSEISPTDLALFQGYLVQRGLADQWTGPPTRLDTSEIRRAYPGCRFYYTFARPPTPPGAASAALADRYEQARAQFKAHSLRVTISINQEGIVRERRTPDDFTSDLSAITTDEEAANAAAAILSLIHGQNSWPGPISVDDVKVVHNERGWLGRVEQTRGIRGTVTFDLRGQCVSIDKTLNYNPPVPP